MEQKELTDKNKVERDIYDLFRQIDIKDILEELQKLKDVKKDLEEIHAVLETAKCCLQKVCSNKSWFCC